MTKRVEFEGKIHEFPDDASDQEISSTLNRDAAVTSLSPPPAPPQGGIAGYLGGFAGAAKDAATGLFNLGTTAFQNPGEAGRMLFESTVTPHVEQFKQAADPNKTLIERGSHALAGMVPLVGPRIKELAERGREDPAGAAGAATFDAATMLLGPRPSMARGLRASAVENNLSLLSPGAMRRVPLAERTAADLVGRLPVARSEASLLEQVAAKRTAAGPPAKSAYAGKGAVSPYQIIKDLDEMRAQKATIKGTNIAADESLDKAITELQEKIIKLNNGGAIAAETLDDFKDKLNKGLVGASGEFRSRAPQTAKAIDEGLARSIKRVLDDKFPDAAKLNANYNLWANAHQFLEDARRKKITAKSGVRLGSSTGFGAMTKRMLPRPVRELPEKIAGIFDSVPWNTVSGATKAKIADAIAASNWTAAESLMTSLIGGRVPKGPEE